MRMIPSAGYMYLGSPYTHRDPYVREYRYLVTMAHLADMLKKGKAVYSPIVHCHELAKVSDLPKDAGFWRAYNFTMLAAAEQFGVLMLPGWKVSAGIKDEAAECRRIGVPIIEIDPYIGVTSDMAVRSQDI